MGRDASKADAPPPGESTAAFRKRLRTVPSAPPDQTESCANATERAREPPCAFQRAIIVPLLATSSATEPSASPHATKSRASSTAAQSGAAASASASPGIQAPTPTPTPRVAAASACSVGGSNLRSEPSSAAAHTAPASVSTNAEITPPHGNAAISRNLNPALPPTPPLAAAVGSDSKRHTRAWPSRPPETTVLPRMSMAVTPPPSCSERTAMEELVESR
mmetsp:Transcript_13103/g.30779  ORF Transcript_13103/g.30779 Transcript_13103/m.30779 type:complete len:220 (+) Transcript_13103:581-1240(+)